MLSGLAIVGGKLASSDAAKHQAGGGRTTRLWLQPIHRVLIYIYQIRFQTSARRLIRSDLSDGIGRIQIRPHILAHGSRVDGAKAMMMKTVAPANMAAVHADMRSIFSGL